MEGVRGRASHVPAPRLTATKTVITVITVMTTMMMTATLTPMSWVWIIGGAVTGGLAGTGMWLWLRTGAYRRPGDVPRASASGRWIVIPLAAVGGTAAAFAPLPLVVAAWVYLVVGTAILWIEVDVHRISHVVTRFWAPAVVVAVLGAALLTGRWEMLFQGSAWAVVLGGLFLLLARTGSSGAGLVVPAAVTGLVVGPLGVLGVFLALLVGFLLPGLAGLVLMVARRGSLATGLPFTPGLLAGTAVALALGTM